MPRSVFLGRAVQPGEPQWLDEDRDWALALAQVEDEACPTCGQPWDQASDKKNEFRYEAKVARCHACTAVGRAISAFEKPGVDTRGLHVHIVPPRRQEAP